VTDQYARKLKMTTIVRVHLDMWRRARIDSIRQRALRAVPSSWLYHLTIQAVVRTLGSREHPDAIGAMEVVRRLGRTP
jgi:hypothetical protein